MWLVIDMDEKERLARIETHLDDMSKKISTIFEMLNKDIVPKVTAVQYLEKDIAAIKSVIAAVVMTVVGVVINSVRDAMK